MRLLATGDQHFDHSSRWEECLRIHDWIAEQAETIRPDVMLCAGDLYERASTPDEREAAAAWVARVADACPVVIVKGNHDRALDVALLRRIKAAHPVIVEEGAGVHYVGGFAIMAAAWPNKAMLAAATQGSAQHDIDADARAALQAVYRGLRAAVELEAPLTPRIGLAHAMVDGSVTSTGQPLIGSELNVGLADLALLGADFTVLGHIHKPQEWSIDGAPALYTGSPYRTAFGETEEKSIVYAEFDGRELVEWRRIPTPARAMVLFNCRFTRETDGPFSGDALDMDLWPDAEIRLRYSVDSDDREEARTHAAMTRDAMLAHGAHSVKVEEVVNPKSTARCAEITQARTLADKLAHLWRVRGDVPDETRATRLCGMAEGVAEEVSRAA